MPPNYPYIERGMVRSHFALKGLENNPGTMPTAAFKPCRINALHSL